MEKEAHHVYWVNNSLSHAAVYIQMDFEVRVASFLLIRIQTRESKRL